MEDIVYKPRYPRQFPGQQIKRKVKRNRRLKDDFTRKLLLKISKQTLAGIVIFALIFAIVKIDTAQTIFLENKIKSTLAYDLDLKSISGGIKGVQSVFNNISNGYDETDGNGLTQEKDKDLTKDASTDGVLNGNEAGEISDEELEPASAVYTDEGSLVESLGYDEGLEESTMDEIEQESQGQLEQDVDSEPIFGGKGYSFLIPIGGIIGSFYGERVHPIKNTILFHKGIDIEAQSGAPIKAAYDGEVIEADKEETYGNYIKLKHIDGLTTLYAHCSKLLISKGQKVKKGDVIAEVGCTGAAEGPHLHFEVRKDNEAVNPLDYITLSNNP